MRLAHQAGLVGGALMLPVHVCERLRQPMLHEWHFLKLMKMMARGTPTVLADHNDLYPTRLRFSFPTFKG